MTLCADRACARVLVEGEGRDGAWIPPSALRPGTLFWRVSTRDGARSATRALEVPTTEMPAGCLRAVVDFDGDGVEDAVTAAPSRACEVRVRCSGAGLAERVFTAAPGVPATRSLRARASRRGALAGRGGRRRRRRLHRRAEARVETLPEGRLAARVALRTHRGRPAKALEVRWSAEERTQNAWGAVRVQPAGDLDDDGYADLLHSRTSGS
ncbi:MAG: hypothetical protein R3A48_25260 [Polyangiales bacterium]